MSRALPRESFPLGEGGAHETAADRLDVIEQKLDGLTTQVAALTDVLGGDLVALRTRVSEIQQRMRQGSSAPPERARELAESGAELAAAVASSTAIPQLDEVFDYFEFERRFRGSVEDIRSRQTKYVKLFAGSKTVIDIGCGRGEFLGLLAENEIPAKGVDIDADMVQFCRAQGLDAVLSDVFDYLRTLPDRSIDGIFAAQVVEHLPPAAMFHLVHECARTLSKRGIFVAETINTRCPIAMNWFYLDPTHARPVPPELLAFACEQALLEVRQIVFSSPVEGSEADPVLEAGTSLPPEVDGYQDYAVVARKPAKGTAASR